MTDDLTADDLRAVVGMLAEATGGEGGLVARREAVLIGLAKLIGAEIWYWVQSAGAGPDRNPAAFAFLTGGWRSPEQQALVVSAHHSPAGKLVNEYFQQRFGQHVTCMRADIAADEIWYDSELYRRYHEPAGLDDFLMSAYPLEGGVISGVGFYRSAAGGRFTARDRAVVHLVTARVGWLHRGPTDLPAAAVVPALSPRAREVLLHLLNGDSRKQIAQKLHRSEHTISDVIKTLHKQLGVSSNGELLAKFLASGPPAAGRAAGGAEGAAKGGDGAKRAAERRGKGG